MKTDGKPALRGVWRRGLCLGVFASSLFGAPLHAGIVSFTSQSPSVELDTNAISFLPPSSKQASAPDFGSFDQSVNLDFAEMGIDQTASQQSTLALTPDGMGAAINATGSVFQSPPGNGINGASTFNVVFQLSQSEPYSLTYAGVSGDARSTSTERFVPGSFTGPSAPGELVGDPHTTEPNSILTYGGTLLPGTYDLSAGAQAMFQQASDASFDVHLAIGTAAVPLPSAFWLALTALPALLLGAALLQPVKVKMIAPATAARLAPDLHR